MRKMFPSSLLLNMAVLAVLLSGPSCRAEEMKAELPKEAPNAKGEFFGDLMDSPIRVKIHFPMSTKPGQDLRTVFVTHPYPKICSGLVCDGDGFQWEIPGGLKANEKVWIRNAESGNECFPGAIPVLIEGPDENGAQSGQAVFDASLCPEKPTVGHLWPYVVELYVDGQLVASTDPGGVIFP